MNHSENRPPVSVIDIQQNDEKLAESIGLLRTESFHDGFLDEATAPQALAVKSHHEESEQLLSRLVNDDIDAEVATRLGYSVEEGKKLGQEWGTMRKQVLLEVDEETGTTFQERSKQRHAPEVYTQEYHDKESILQLEVEHSATSAAESLSILLDEIEQRKQDPAFIEAVNMWANSPNAAGEVGEDGLGFNAGIVHFFEYRGRKGKSDRFARIPEEMSVDGFIQFSQRMYSVMQSVVEQSAIDGEVQGAVLRDSDGAERVFALTNDSQRVVGFKPVDGDTHRMTTVLIHGQSPKSLEKDIARVMDGNDKGVVNRLNGPAELISKI